ncbi:MAG: FAD-dependent monooxygenase [Myxococcaceae bacterium]
MTTPTPEVVIAGAGPTGLMLAAELKLAGVEVLLIERRASQAVEGSRAGGLHVRTMEVLDQRGVLERFVSAGQRAQAASFGAMPLDLSDFPSRHPFVLALWQDKFEQLLAQWVLDELAVPIVRSREVTGFTQHAAHVDVAVSDGSTVRAQYLVGCDGGRSLIRKAANIDFAGWDASVSYILAEARVATPPPYGLRRNAQGVQAIGKLDDHGRVRVVLIDRELKAGETPTLDELKVALTDVYGSDFGVHDVTWISRFTDASRQAVKYCEGRVLLAGDAAHVHSPAGGQGLNLGVQDAVNLGWKLAQVVKGTSHDSLLDTYQAERHPVGARVLKLSMAMTALQRGDDRANALRDVVTELSQTTDGRRLLGGMISALDVRYAAAPDAHPLVGRRMPDLELADGKRVFSLLHRARPVALSFGAPRPASFEPWAGRVQWLDARYEGAWVLPVIGGVAAPRAVLVRPDGHVAWAATDGDAGLVDALTTWFGDAKP